MCVSEVHVYNMSGRDSSKFECNICIEVAKDPVVTRCGHLYW